VCACFLWAKGPNVKDIHKETLPVYGGKSLPRKAVHSWFQKFSQGRSKITVDVRPGRRSLRRKDFYAAGFDELIKRWEKCIGVGGGYVGEKCFFQVRISHILRFVSVCDLFTDYPTYKTSKGISHSI
jgi:hypothetical protein